jgi:hypothetical protein
VNRHIVNYLFFLVIVLSLRLYCVHLTISIYLADISSIVVSIFAFRFPMSNDNKCEGFSNLNCFSIILKFKSLFGSKLISLKKFRRVSEQEKNF